jgi:deoxyribonuclease V
VAALALEKLVVTPDLILVDGQGLAHPRRFGIACHIGLLAEIPTIGCAKSILRGRHGPLGVEEGAVAELVDGHEVVGAALRTKKSASPVYVSVGHKVELASAVRWVLRCCRGYRLPEPTRLAHLAAGGQLGERSPSSQAPVQQTLF